jgi:hypothetical protein
MYVVFGAFTSWRTSRAPEGGLGKNRVFSFKTEPSGFLFFFWFFGFHLGFIWVFLGFIWVLFVFFMFFFNIFAQKREFLGVFQFQEYF